MPKFRGQNYSAKLPFADPNALTFPQVQRRFGYSRCQLYLWAKEGIPALGYLRLPTGMTPGLGPGKPSMRVFCGRTLQQAYDLESKGLPEGFLTWTGIVAVTRIPQSTLRLLDSKGKIDCQTVPVRGNGRRLQKVYRVADVKHHAHVTPPGQFTDDKGKGWITARAAEKLPALKGIKYRFLFRAVSQDCFTGINERPIVWRHPTFQRTYFSLEQLRRVARSPYKPRDKEKPFTDADGTWLTVDQAKKVVGLSATILASFWENNAERGGKKLLEIWVQNAKSEFKKKRIPPTSEGAKKRYPTVRGFELESLRKLAAILNKPFCLDGFEIPKMETKPSVPKLALPEVAETNVSAHIPKYFAVWEHSNNDWMDLAKAIYQASLDPSDNRSENQIAVEFFKSKSRRDALNELKRIRMYCLRKSKERDVVSAHI